MRMHLAIYLGFLRTVMVSLRRRRLLGLCSGQSSSMAPVTPVSDHGQHTENLGENSKPVSERLVPSNDGFTLKEEMTSEYNHGSPEVSATSLLKENNTFQSDPEVKRRKRHKRKLIENQEPCTMRGVYYKNRKWQAAIKVDKKQIHLGTVGSEEEAAQLYDRAAFMCGREPNLELSEEEKQELRKYNWEEFLAMTRSAITNKKSQRRSQNKHKKEWGGNSLSSSPWEDDDNT